MDIITVFETVGGGSIPSWPASLYLVSLMVELHPYTVVAVVRFHHEVPSNAALADVVIATV